VGSGGLRGRIFILGFAYISRKFPSDPRLFPSEIDKYLHPHRVTGVYKFYENWSTETFRKRAQRSGLFVPRTKNHDGSALRGGDFRLEESKTSL